MHTNDAYHELIEDRAWLVMEVLPTWHITLCMRWWHQMMDARWMVCLAFHHQ